jgi:hypothetical protein
MNIWFGQRPQRGRPPARQHPRARRHRAAPHTLQLQGLQAGHQGHLHRTFLSKALQKFYFYWHNDSKLFQNSFRNKATVYNSHITFYNKMSRRSSFVPTAYCCPGHISSYKSLAVIQLSVQKILLQLCAEQLDGI